MFEKIFDIILKQDEIGWKSLIIDLVKTEGMDPWDVDVSLLTQKYIEMIKKMKEMDLKISGKVLLAAALLLKIKSNRLVGDDLAAFDNMFSGEGDNLDDEIIKDATRKVYEKRDLIPRTPQPRKRKVSIYDLIDALQKALEVQKRRTVNRVTPEMIIPEKKMDVSTIIKNLYLKIMEVFKNNDNLTFSKLVPSENKEDKVLTFVPLLHLTNQRKIDLEQVEHFGEIEIKVNSANAVKSELN